LRIVKTVKMDMV